MAKAADPTLVGGFVLGALVLAVVGVLTFSSFKLFEREFRMVAYFESSISGLDVGAPVRFKGVRVGSVTGISAVLHDQTEEIRIPVELTLYENAVKSEADGEAQWDNPAAMMERFVERGLRAELRQDSFLTGKLFIALVNEPESEVRRITDGLVFEMPTVKGGLERLAKSIKDLPLEALLNRAVSALEAVEQLARRPEIGQILANLDQLAGGLNEGLEPALADLERLLATVGEDFEGLVVDVRRLLGELDQRLGPVADSTTATMQHVDASLSELDQLLQLANERLGPLATSASETMDGLRGTAGSVDSLVGKDATVVRRLAGLLEELTEAARAIRVLADTLERHPEALLSGKD